MADDRLPLTPEQLCAIVETKATCPFIGTGVATGLLPVRNETANPLASIEDVRRLGNTGGGDLGEILVFFATGNHALMRGRDGRLDRTVPVGRFSLEFPGSQGSHPGHSNILEGDPATLGSGRLSLPDFERLASRATNGFIRHSDVGIFIADNLHRDPKSKVFGAAVAGLLARDLEHFVKAAGLDLLERLRGAAEDGLHRDLEQKLTILTGEDNLIGSCGEFGLLFAFLANSPHTQKLDGETALSLKEVESMFVHKRFPEGWDHWKKTRSDWVTHSIALMISAGRAYLSLHI